MTDTSDPADPFERLRDDGRHRVAPDPGFVARLRNRLEAAVAPGSSAAPGTDTALADASQDEAADEPTTRTPVPEVSLPDRKQSTMSTAATDTHTDTDTDTPPDTAPLATQILTPYISVHDGVAALDWYAAAFGAIETVRYVGDDGRLGHAEFLFNGARVMLSDAYPEIGVVDANSYEGSSCALHVEVGDCDSIHDRAVEAGAASMMAPTDQPHGARTATIIDPFGHRWMLSQQLSSPTSAEIDAAYDDFTVVDADTD